MSKPAFLLETKSPLSPWQRLIWLILPWLMAPALLAWALRGVHWSEIWHTLERLGLGQLFVLMLINASIFLLIAVRWWLILRAQGCSVSCLATAGYRLISFGVSYFTPGPQFGGEPLQVYFLQNRHGILTATALASVSLDKMLELLANFAFLLIGFVATLQAGWSQHLTPLQSLAWMTVPFLMLLAYLWALRRGFTPLSRLARWALPPSTRANRLIEVIQVAEGQISHLCQHKLHILGLALLVSALIWLGMVVEYGLAARFLGVALTPAQAVAAQTAAMVAFLFPLPAGLGALEASQVMLLTALGFAPSIGLSLSVLMRGRDITLGGLGLLWGVILSGKRLWNSSLSINWSK